MFEELREYFLHNMRDLQTEEIHAWFINSDGALIHQRMDIASQRGSAALSPRDLFRLAYENQAVALVLAHNHPNGDCTPSWIDEDFTSMIHKYGKDCEAFLLDHFVVGDGFVYSFAERKFIMLSSEMDEQGMPSGKERKNV